MTQESPRINSGWIRALLFFVAAMITSQIFAGIGMVGVLLVSGFDISTLSNQDALMKELNQINFFLILKIIEFSAVMLCVWLFVRYIDRQPVNSIGLVMMDIKKTFNLDLVLERVSLR